MNCALCIVNFLHHIFAFDADSPLLFTQFYFWAFFALVFALFALLISLPFREGPGLGLSNRRLHLRNVYLLFVSWFFYYKTSGLFLLILAFITLSDWIIAGRIHKHLNRPKAAKQDDSPLNNTNGALNALSNAWAILQTFTFITFTRLFFRSSSNLDPATANEVAWATAKNMVNQIGGAWNNAIIPDFLWEYRWVVAMFVAGMVIHWLPTNWKRRYRLAFSAMPLWLMVIAVCVAIVIIYQFVSAEMQPFIYFQF